MYENPNFKNHSGASRATPIVHSSPVWFFHGDIMKKIDISTRKYPNEYTLVDDDDYERISKYKWHIHPSGNVKRAARSSVAGDHVQGKRITIFLHRVIMAAPDGFDVDHINHDGLDNRKKNLRLCNPSENQHNRRPQIGCASRYKGVTRNGNKWRSRIRIPYSKRETSLGTFESEIEAALAYDKKAEELYGEFACFNFPHEGANG